MSLSGNNNRPMSLNDVGSRADRLSRGTLFGGLPKEAISTLIVGTANLGDDNLTATQPALLDMSPVLGSRYTEHHGQVDPLLGTLQLARMALHYGRVTHDGPRRFLEGYPEHVQVRTIQVINLIRNAEEQYRLQ